MKDTNKKYLSSQPLQAAMACYKAGQPLVAEEMYRKILLDDPKNVLSLQMLAIIAAESDRYGEAVALLGRAIEAKKNDPLLIFTLGFTLQRWGKLDEALLQYQKVISLKPDYVEAYMHIGDILKNQGRFN